MEKTIENLKSAFDGEAQANRRYLIFAQKAKEEGYPQASKLFRAAAEAETVHAFNHFRIIGETKNTVNNLKTAIARETCEHKHMYHDYIRTAKKEKNMQAEWSFSVASQVEHVHTKLFTKAMKAFKAGKDLAKVDYYICNVCGNTFESEIPSKCPICGSPKEKIIAVS